MESRRNILLAFAGLSFILLLMIYNFYFFHPHFYGDFHHFYYAAKAMVNGENIYTSGEGGYIYPPFFAFLISPMTDLPLIAACIIWQWINLFLLLAILYFGFNSLTQVFKINCNLWQSFAACSLALLFTFQELMQVFRWNQTDLLILAGLTMGLYWLKRKPYWAGICLGIVANIKYQSLFFLPFFLLRGRWQNAAGFCIGAAAAALTPVLFIGWDLNIHYLLIAARGMIHPHTVEYSQYVQAARVPDILWLYNISLTNGLLRIFLAHDLPGILVLIPLFFLAILYVFILWKIYSFHSIPFFWRTPSRLINSRLEDAVFNIEYLVVLASIFIFSPQCLLRHLVLILPLNLFAALVLLFPKPNLSRWPMFIGIMIIQLGKLYGALHSSWEVNWRFIGGPCWTLFAFMPFFTYSGLVYGIYLYGNTFIDALKKKNYDMPITSQDANF